MKKMFLLSLFITSLYYAQIPDVNNVLVVTHNINETRKAYCKTTNSSLNKLINSYKIYNCKKVFSKSKRSSLQNIYLIECNDLKLMNDLNDKFKHIYPAVENANGIPLTTPNDYSNTRIFTGADQAELRYIRAPEAWNLSTGSSNIKIGITDTNFSPNHEELVNSMSLEVNVSANNLNSSNQHGSMVAALVVAETNNGIGISSIGYNSFAYIGVGTNTSVLDQLS